MDLKTLKQGYKIGFIFLDVTEKTYQDSQQTSLHQDLRLQEKIPLEET